MATHSSDSPPAQSAPPRAEHRPYDVVVLGATGVAGRQVAAHLALRAEESGLRWAAAGRDRGRVEAALREAGITGDVLVADVEDAGSLETLAASTRSLANLVGPYTQRAEPVIAACVAAGTHYADLTGETPHARDMVDRWHVPALTARVKVVQVAGFEALPFDVGVLLAHEAAAAAGETLVEADAVLTADVVPRISRLTDGVSGGTLQSIALVLAEPELVDVTDPGILLPGLREEAASALRRRSPLRLAARSRAGAVVSPMIPAAFINPPVIARTATLLSAEGSRTDEPLRYREGSALGPTTSRAAWASAWALAVAQLVLVGATRLPLRARKVLSDVLARALPGSGEGPTTREVLEGWQWRVDVAGRTATGAAVTVRVDGEGHPGYAATSRMLAELCAAMASPEAPRRSGALTPALALGTAALEDFARSGVRFTLVDAPEPLRRRAGSRS